MFQVMITFSNSTIIQFLRIFQKRDTIYIGISYWISFIQIFHDI